MSIDWKKKDQEEQMRIRERQKGIDALHSRYRLTSSAPAQKTTLASLFSSPFRNAGGGGSGGGGSGGAGSGGAGSGGAGAKGSQLQLQTQLAPRLGLGLGRESQRMIERTLEELSQQIGVVSEALEQVQQNTAFNHEQNLDRLDSLRVQIRRESERLMRTIITVRESSNCDLADPTTYIYCIELIYKLLFKIFVFLSQLVFVVGNSFKRFLSYMPFPFSILVFIAIAFSFPVPVIYCLCPDS